MKPKVHPLAWVVYLAVMGWLFWWGGCREKTADDLRYENEESPQNYRS